MSKRRGVYNEELVEKNVVWHCWSFFNDWYNNAGICMDAPAAKTQTTTEDQTEEPKSEVQAEESQVEEPQQRGTNFGRTTIS